MKMKSFAFVFVLVILFSASLSFTASAEQRLTNGTISVSGTEFNLASSTFSGSWWKRKGASKGAMAITFEESENGLVASFNVNNGAFTWSDGIVIWNEADSSLTIQSDPASNETRTDKLKVSIEDDEVVLGGEYSWVGKGGNEKYDYAIKIKRPLGS